MCGTVVVLQASSLGMCGTFHKHLKHNIINQHPHKGKNIDQLSLEGANWYLELDFFDVLRDLIRDFIYLLKSVHHLFKVDQEVENGSVGALLLEAIFFIVFVQ